jgi:hypothetical protein
VKVLQLVMSKWFSLPHLGTEVFSELKRTGLKYDKRFGFQLTSSTDIARVISILSHALGTEVTVARSCFICERPIEEHKGEESTICVECMKNANAYDLYCMRFAKLMETI